MLDYIEYDSEFALIGIPSLQMERFDKADGWTRPLISKMVNLMNTPRVIDFAEEE